jgi:hypothetical protein
LIERVDRPGRGSRIDLLAGPVAGQVVAVGELLKQRVGVLVADVDRLQLVGGVRADHVTLAGRHARIKLGPLGDLPGHIVNVIELRNHITSRAEILNLFEAFVETVWMIIEVRLLSIGIRDEIDTPAVADVDRINGAQGIAVAF